MQRLVEACSFIPFSPSDVSFLLQLSKAAMLQKGAEHIKHLRNERNILKERMDALRMERDSLNNSLK